MNSKECPCAELHLIHTKKRIIGATDNWEAREKLEKAIRKVRRTENQVTVGFRERKRRRKQWRGSLIPPKASRPSTMEHTNPSSWSEARTSHDPLSAAAVPMKMLTALLRTASSPQSSPCFYLPTSFNSSFPCQMPWKTFRCSVCLLPICWTLSMQGFLPP